jgi:drug/metabolite transporter (DMT)-like permease
VIWGFLLFGETPQPLVASGIVIIVAAGIVAVRQKANQ